MTVPEYLIEIFRGLSILALLFCGLFVALIWGADTLQLYAVSDVIQVALDVAVIALIVSAGLQLVVGLPLWLIPKLGRSRG